MAQATLLAAGLAALAAAALADTSSLAGLDLSVHQSDIEPSITIRESENRVSQEYRVNGRLYMVKITPSVGAPYYLVDEDGSGDMTLSRGTPGIENNIPQWTLFSW